MTTHITPEQYKHFWEKGWLVVEGVYTREQAEAAAQFSLDMVNKEFDPNQTSYLVDRSADGKEASPRKLVQPFSKAPAFYGNLMFRSPLRDLIRQLTGADPILCTDQVFFKPPRHGSSKEYHQDNAYFLCHPDDHVITAWIAMDDVDEENGCLRYIDGSHLGPILPSRKAPGKEHDLTPDPSLVDRSKESPARVKKGGVVFHHSKALHGSGENRSNRWRRGYATHWVAADVTAENDTLDTAYYKKPELWDGWGEEFKPAAVAAR